jgi:hypothetical protein
MMKKVILALILSMAVAVYGKKKDSIANPEFPEVNVQYGMYGSSQPGSSGFSYPACADKITLNNTATSYSPNSILSCGDDKTCAVYCFDQKYQSTYNCGTGDAAGIMGIIVMIFFFGMCCGGGGVFCYYRKKYGQPYSGYIEISA